MFRETKYCEENKKWLKKIKLIVLARFIEIIWKREIIRWTYSLKEKKTPRHIIFLLENIHKCISLCLERKQATPILRTMKWVNRKCALGQNQTIFFRSIWNRLKAMTGKNILYRMYFFTYNHLFLMCLITNFFLCWKWSLHVPIYLLTKWEIKKTHQETKKTYKNKSIFIIVTNSHSIFCQK